MNLNLNPTLLLNFLQRYARPLVGLAVAAVFGYTGWVINAAFNVQPTAPVEAAGAKVVFDKKALETVKSLHVVNGQVTPTSLGKPDPFGN